MEAIVNKVAESGLVTLNLEQFLPSAITVFDLKDYLFMQLILKEKDFREQLKNTDWTAFEHKHVTILCSVDAIIPVWAYMLVASYLQPVASSVYNGSVEECTHYLMLKNIEQLDTTEYTDKRIVVKGCGEIPISEKAYTAITAKLLPAVKSIMYGEPCSTVPIYKQKK
jgi:hypothetical protein